MSLSASIKRMANQSLPLGVRYMAMLHALEESHTSYWTGWRELKNSFGIEVGDPVSNEILISIANHLAALRDAWLSQEMETQAKVRRLKYLRGKGQKSTGSVC